MRELQILDLLSYGLTSREIGLELFLSAETIRSHRKNLITKMEAKNVANLIRIAFEKRIIKSQDSKENYTYNFNNHHELVA